MDDIDVFNDVVDGELDYSGDLAIPELPEDDSNGEVYSSSDVESPSFTYTDYSNYLATTNLLLSCILLVLIFSWLEKHIRRFTHLLSGRGDD